MRNLSVLQGGRLPLLIEQGDSTSISATFYAKGQESGTIIEITDTFDADGVADVSLPGTDTLVVDVYDYQINENFTEGEPLKYPNPDNCSGSGCELPTLTICAALDEETS